MAGKFMQAARSKMEKKGTVGALHEELGVPKGKKIPTERINSELSQLHSEAKGGKLSAAELKKVRRLSFAKATRS